MTIAVDFLVSSVAVLGCGDEIHVATMINNRRLICTGHPFVLLI